MPGVQRSRSIISRSSFGSCCSVCTSRLSQAPLTASCGSRSRSTLRMFLASWRMKCLRTGRLLMVISGKTLTISFMKRTREGGAEKQGRGL
ncbi:hypothetical protein D9M68_642430 [compost metagenome]